MLTSNSVSSLPVSFEVFESGLQVIEQVDFLAALRAVNIQKLTVVQVSDLLRGLASTGNNK